MTTVESTAAYAGYAWDKDADGIVTVSMDDPDSAVNTMNRHFVSALEATVDRLETERDDIAGVVLTSAKKSWFAGGDLNLLRAADPARSAEETAHLEHVKALLRRVERLGRPVVAAMNGSALGGGLEVALACHHRIAASDAEDARFGVPEVSLGLIPGGGGVTRLVRMLGLQRALDDVILPATRFRADDALAIGIIDEVAPAAELDARARAFIAANPAPVKPWDDKGFRLPGGSPTSPAIAGLLPAMPAMLRRQLKGAPLPAPRAALAAAVEGAYVDFDTASTIESRYLVQLTHSQVAKNMITAFFFDLQEINAGASRPQGFPRFTTTKVGVIGAGVMSAAIAYASAEAGIDVVLVDVSADPADFAGVDLVIEAVSDSVSGEPRVSPEVQVPLALVHVFPAADGMPLVEIVRRADTGDEAVARAFDFVQQLRKIPIVVTDARGFFTSRVISARIAEAVAAIGEGVEPASVEQAALQAGYPTGALQLLDELSLSLSQQARATARAATEAAGETWVAHPSEAVVDWMVDEAQRPGRAAGRGFYDYDEAGTRVGIWPGLREKFGSGSTSPALRDLQERMLFAEALEAIHCFDDGVVASVADANIGSIYGIGFPAWTGGVLQYVNQYEGGLAGFVARTRNLAETYGERFTPPPSLLARAAAGQEYRRE